MKTAAPDISHPLDSIINDRYLILMINKLLILMLNK